MVTAGERTVALGGARQRTVLSLLLLSPGRIVPVDTLVAEVWNDRPPATARTQIAIVIAALRKALKAEGAAEEVIATAHPGYLLRIEGHTLDSAVFTRLVAEAETAVREQRPADAARAYAEALALWRGRTLAGVAGQRVEDEAARWEEVRLHAREALTGVQLELGRHRLLLPDLAATVRDHPLRERARYHLILAQYRSGRRAEALDGFREARRRFIDELGMEPGPELQELHDAILRDDPSLAVDAPAALREAPAERRTVIPSELPPDVPGFAGRQPELAALDSLVDARDGGGRTPTVGLITGVAGVGKTGLGVRWAHRAAGHYPDGRLFADLRGYDENHAPTEAGEILSRFLRSLGVGSDEVPNGLEDRIAMYRSVLAERQVLLVLDNVRTLAQIRPLLPGNGGSTVLVTSREQLEQLVTWPAAARVHLGLLPQDRSVELLAGIVGESRILAAPEESARLVALCDRLPLALRIAAARLASKPHWSVRHLVTRLSDERRRLDELSQGEFQIRAGFRLSYRYLDKDAARLYRHLGLLGVPDFTAWVGAALMDLGVLEAEQLVEHLVDAQFLQVVGVDATGRLRYGFHDLMRLYAGELAREEDSEEDRLAACDRVFRTGLTIALAAQRREHGGDHAILRVRTPLRAVDPALLEELIAAPLEWYEAERLSLIAMVEQAAGLGMDELAWGLSSAMGALFEARNYLDDWRRCGELALEAARIAGNLGGQAAMEQQIGTIDLRLRRLDESSAHFERAIDLYARAGELLGPAPVLANLAVIDRVRGDYDRAMGRLEEALPLTRAAGDLASEAYTLNNMAQIALDRGRPEEALGLSRDAVRVSERIGGDARSLAMAMYRQAGSHLALGQLESAEEAYGTVVRIVTEKADMLGLAYALMGLATARGEAGAAESAEQTYREALKVARRQASPLVEGEIRLALGRLHCRVGRTSEGRAHLTAALGVFQGIGAPPWEAKAARALEEAGAGEDAQPLDTPRLTGR
ncbi:BTAD domain-containing putative transcriptional regulator [Streptomyces sp. NPDC057011]|uniref:AfsR/SARP family transcriptional regulator n=1 Tax=unclassified Streptomyces TaxID=2593676 RepID=UPI00363A9D09